jgi:hypothetical protein
VGLPGVGGVLSLGRPLVLSLLGVRASLRPGDRAGARREVQGARGLAAGRARPAPLASRDVGWTGHRRPDSLANGVEEREVRRARGDLGTLRHLRGQL